MPSGSRSHFPSHFNVVDYEEIDMYGAIIAGQPIRYDNTIAVRSESDLAYLVKESEIITGLPGREFFAVLSDGIVRYRVNISSVGFEVSQVAKDSTGERLFLTSDTLPESAVGRAISDGRLFCHAVW